MADQKVKVQENVAQTAYQMAVQMWLQTHKSQPGVGDEEFVKLVSSCAIALQGYGNQYEW